MVIQQFEKEHLKALRPHLAKCTVLLAKNGDFPLDEAGEVALYGSGARRTLKGGTGSGEVNSRFFVNIEKGLEKSGFTVTTKAWLDEYDQVVRKAREDFLKEIRRRAKEHRVPAVIEGMGAVMPEPEYSIPVDGAGDTAVYVLSRICGEGNDRRMEDGDFYLTETEIRDIRACAERYERFMLVLNTGGPVDLTPVADVPNILILSQLGVDMGLVLARLLLGKMVPSGKLTTTWAGADDYPVIGDFGDINETRYREGIYVGYRYFDSAGRRVIYPFGYGLGYTEFELMLGTPSAFGEEISLPVTVKNAGAYKGREVVQLYVSVPEGRLDQPFQVLAGWAATGLLEPGEEETVTVRFRMSELASYDEENARYILEAGQYILRAGASSRDTAPSGIVELAGEAVVLQTKSALGTPDFKDWRPNGLREEALPEGLPALAIRPEDIEERQLAEPDEMEPEVKSLSNEELCFMNVGAFDPKAGFLSIIGSASQSVAGAAGETATAAPDIFKKPLVMADGPAGLRLSRRYVRTKNGAVKSLGASLPESFEGLLPKPAVMLMNAMGYKPKKGDVFGEQFATAIPIGTAIAQSWDPEFAELCGDIVGSEMERFGVHMWLAPALNIHRNVLCGRNFEYYSEDPLISGRMAAGIARGVQKHPGRSVVIKHFAANNQEYNRYQNNSCVSERAMREIYLKGFAICIREGRPHALMSSYNLLNGQHTSEREDLNEQVLRREMGFDGVVMTDWLVAGMVDSKGMRYPGAKAGAIAAAGESLLMPGSKKDVEALKAALSDGTLTRERLEKNVSRLCRVYRELTGEL